MNENLIILLAVLFLFSPVIYQWYLLLKERKVENRIRIKKLLRFTKYSFIILIFISITFGILNHTNFLNYEKPIPFENFDRITFENFRGLEFFKKSLYGNEKFAYVVTSIESEVNDNSVSVHSYFHPSRSFVYKKNTSSRELLKHEKYHIKITELFAREARKRISNLKNFDKNKIEEIIKEVKLKERVFQKEYDYNTFHSYVFSEQKKYEKKIDSLLTLLKEYKNPKISINDKN